MTNSHADTGNHHSAKLSDISSRAKQAASDVGEKASNALDAATDYVGENTFADMVTDAKKFVKSHPAQAVVGALVVGFLVGRMGRRD